MCVFMYHVKALFRIKIFGLRFANVITKYFCNLGRRRSTFLIPLLLWILLTLVTLWWLGDVTSKVLLPPPPPDQNLGHFRRNNNLQYYLDNIQLLIEPSSVCSEHTPVVILVTSAPSHVEHRQAIRSTWGSYLHTYFLLGVEGENENVLSDSYIEAKQYSDMIVYNLVDHYQNLTLKTMLMVQWTLDRCAGAGYLLKTDDDVLVNPWTLKVVLEENSEAQLLGYKFSDVRLHRDEYSKWFSPRWLHAADSVSEFLSGTAYLINGNTIEKVFSAAKKVSLINLEDIYLTNLVSKSRLNLTLVHDRRLSPYKPWIPLDCAYWTHATIHSLSPTEMTNSWAKVEKIGKQYEDNNEVCVFYRNFLESDKWLY